ncbi:unnamed protein product [Prunus armeniaca]|uniref:Uncharacterized protein n=1 Tax=Prunus armeniaca TaxID=36596 RepID=A0A6J5VX58_PRUAR|nr:unnamed protein product [Prunus armeniaca]
MEFTHFFYIIRVESGIDRLATTFLSYVRCDGRLYSFFNCLALRLGLVMHEYVITAYYADHKRKVQNSINPVFHGLFDSSATLGICNLD